MDFNLSDDEIMGTDKSFLKRRENGLMLSDNDIEILKRNEINYLEFSSLEALIFKIQESLEEIEDDELENLSMKLGEYNYYNYTNK